MIKYIKNISQSTFSIAGFPVLPSEIKEISYLKQVKYFNSSDDSIDILINNNQALLSLDGTTTLSKAASLIIAKTIGQAEETYFKNKNIRNNGLSSESVQDAIEESFLNPDNLPNGKLLKTTFTYHGTARNRWLRVNHSLGSDSVPFIVPFNCVLIGMTMINDAYADTDVEIHVMKRNSEITNLSYLWPIRDSREALINIPKNTIGTSFEYGDKIGAYVKDRGSNLKKVNIDLYFIVQDAGIDHNENFYNDLERE